MLCHLYTFNIFKTPGGSIRLSALNLYPPSPDPKPPSPAHPYCFFGFVVVYCQISCEYLFLSTCKLTIFVLKYNL